MLETLDIIDRTLSNLLAFLIPHTRVTDVMFSFLSLEGLSFWIWVVVLGVLALWREIHEKKVVVSFLITFAVTFLLVNVVVKNIVQRERPWVAQKLTYTTCPNDFSFPSGHASGAFAGATIFAFFDRKRRTGYYTIAGMIAFSRIYLQCHYLGDVLAGAVVGYVIAKGYICIYEHSIKLQDKQ